jgi:hypothetical protein
MASARAAGERAEPSSSPYGAPIMFVQKKDGRLRMVIDYRALSKLMVQNRFPLPRIDDTLDAMRGATVFTSLDHHKSWPDFWLPLVAYHA